MNMSGKCNPTEVSDSRDGRDGKSEVKNEMQLLTSGSYRSASSQEVFVKKFLAGILMQERGKENQHSLD